MDPTELLRNEDTLALVIMGGIAITWILAATIRGIVKTNAREKSRREIAAYIAEGAMTPEQGERLMRAQDV